MNFTHEEIALACNIGGIILNAAAIGVALYVAHKATNDQNKLADKQAVLLTQQETILKKMKDISEQSIINERKTATIRAYTDLFEDVLTWLECKGGEKTIEWEIQGYKAEAAAKSCHENSLLGMKEYVNKIQRINAFAAGITPEDGKEPIYDWDIFEAVGGVKYFNAHIIKRLNVIFPNSQIKKTDDIKRLIEKCNSKAATK